MPYTNLFNLLALVQSGPEGQPPSAYYLFESRTKKLIAGPDESLAALKRDPVVLKLEPSEGEDGRRPHEGVEGQAGEDDTKIVPPGKTTPGFPTGYQVLTAPNRTVVITCDSRPSRRPARALNTTNAPRRASTTTTSSSTASTRATRTARTRR